MKDYMKYRDKICVVTGASSGMGKATAEILVDAGAQVYALNRRPSKVAGVEEDIICDLADRASIDHAFSMIPDHVDCYFGVAGLSGAKNDFRTTFNVDYLANRYIVETYLKKRMSAGGAIEFVTSTAGIAWRENMDECTQILELSDWDDVQKKIEELVDEDTQGTHAYMYAKRLANAYACTLAVELAASGIRVNALMPGSTDTGMKDEFAKMAGGLDNMIKFAGMAGRLATSEEMGTCIVFLNSDMARFVSGEELVVDYCDNAMKKLGMKREFCGGPALS